MKIAIIGGGNMGGAIAGGFLVSKAISPQDLTVIEAYEASANKLKSDYPELKVVINDFSAVASADLVIIAIKPWLVESVLLSIQKEISNPSQIVASIVGGLSISQLQQWVGSSKTIYRIIPNTAIALRESMTFISSANASKDQDEILSTLFGKLGKVELIDEDLMPAATSLASCGIAFAFRYIRAAMEGGVEMGFTPDKAKSTVIQTLRGAIELLEKNGTHPEVEVDKVTTAGGITIKGLNEMEHAGFTSSVIKGLLASKR